MGWIRGMGCVAGCFVALVALQRGDARADSGVTRLQEEGLAALADDAKVAGETVAMLDGMTKDPAAAQWTKDGAAAQLGAARDLAQRIDAAVARAKGVSLDHGTRHALAELGAVKKAATDLGNEARRAYVAANAVASGQATTAGVGGGAATGAAASGLVPVCEIAFAGGGAGATLSIDGTKAMALPAKVKVGSGRHVLRVAAGGTTTERRELLVCGHVRTVTFDEVGLK